MGFGWGRSICSTVTKGKKEATSTATAAPPLQQNSATSRLRCKTNTNDEDDTNDLNQVSLKMPRKATQKSHSKSQKIIPNGYNSSSPRSPLSILKNTLRLSRSCCGVCMQSLKTGKKMAIFTAECAHEFHFPCITSHVKKQDALVCPVCQSAWKDVPLLSIHKPSKIQELGYGDEEIFVASRTSLECLKQGCWKSYADDEPLISPKLNVIPITNKHAEADRFEEEEEEEEFQGFIVNPLSSNDDAFAVNGFSRNVQVCVLPEVAVISVGQTYETYAVVLKVKAPPPPPPPSAASKLGSEAVRRAPMDLVTVLDVSDSMSGATLQMLKRTMRLVISSLGSTDRLSIVAFSATPKRLTPLQRMTSHGQRTARRMIDRLSCSHGSSMSEALREASKVLEDRRERNPVASIILLSDGRDDEIPIHEDTNQRSRFSHASSTRFSHIEIPADTFEDPTFFSRQPAEETFSKCVGGLLSVVIHDLKINVGVGSGSDPAVIAAIYSYNGQSTVIGSSNSIKLGNLYAEEEKEILVELRVPLSSIGSHLVFSVSSCHKDPATQEVVLSDDHTLLVPSPQRSPATESLRYSFITTQAIAESRGLIEMNDVQTAMELLSSAQDMLLQSRSESSTLLARDIELELAELQRRQYNHHFRQSSFLN